MILGKVTAVDNINGIRVMVDGEESATTKKYSYLASYVPAVNDRVLIEEVNGSYVILGKICSEVEQSGIVRKAATADSATNAVNAQTAANCTGNAATATTAAACTGNAATSSKCTGNAATATTADAAKSIDSIVTER